MNKLVLIVLAALAALAAAATAQVAVSNWAGANNFQGPIGVAIRVTIVSPVTVSGTTDYFICVNNAGATTVNLPAAPPDGRTFLIKDCNGGAGPITITPASGTIDGAGTYVISTSRASVAVTYSAMVPGWLVN